MTATHTFPEAYYFSQPFILSDTNETSVYTVPTDKYALINQIWASDDAADARTLTVEINKSGTDYTLAYQKAIAANAQMDLKFDQLLLLAGETVDLTASAAGIHGFVSGIEYSKFPGQ